MSVPNGNDPPTLIADYALETAFNLCVAGQDYTLWWELGRAALERMKADSQDDGEDTTAFARADLLELVETTLRNTSSDLASAIELFDDVIPEEYHVDVGSPFGDMMHELKIQMVLRHYETTATSSARKTQTRFPGIEELFRGIGLPPSELETLLADLDAVRLGKRDGQTVAFLQEHEWDVFRESFLHFLNPIHRGLPESRLRKESEFFAGLEAARNGGLDPAVAEADEKAGAAQAKKKKGKEKKKGPSAKSGGDGRGDASDSSVEDAVPAIHNAEFTLAELRSAHGGSNSQWRIQVETAANDFVDAGPQSKSKQKPGATGTAPKRRKSSSARRGRQEEERAEGPTEESAEEPTEEPSEGPDEGPAFGGEAAAGRSADPAGHDLEECMSEGEHHQAPEEGSGDGEEEGDALARSIVQTLRKASSGLKSKGTDPQKLFGAIQVTARKGGAKRFNEPSSQAQYASWSGPDSEAESEDGRQRLPTPKKVVLEKLKKRTKRKRPKTADAGDNQDWAETSASPGARRRWTEEEVNRFIEGVGKHGVGRWELIRKSCDLSHRTGVNLKDKWRNLRKMGRC